MLDLLPSPWITRFAQLIPRGGVVLDAACGGGRHARLLASMGYRVEAVDRDATAVQALSGTPGVTARVVDLEGETWPYRDSRFDGVVVANYLYRPHFESLIDMLHPGGVLIYETFMIGNEAFGRPANPNYLLQPSELLERVRGRLTVVAFEQGRVETPKRAVMQRICAINAELGSLPDAIP